MCGELFGLQSGRFAGALGQAEVGVGGEVLFAGVGQDVVDEFLVAVTAHGSVRLACCGPVVRAVAVVERDQFPGGQFVSGGAPPRVGLRRQFGRVLIRQHVEQLAWPSGEQRPPSSAIDVDRLPAEFAVAAANRPLEPVALGGVPANPVRGEGVEQLVAENDAANLRRVRRRIVPLDLPGELGQALGLPTPPLGRRLGDRVSQPLEQRLVVGGEPFENVARQAAVVRAGLGDPHRPGDRPEPFREAEREQLAEHRADADARDEVAPAADLAGVFFVIAKLRMIQRQRHEPRKRHRAAVADFGADDLGEWVRSLRHGAHSD